LSCGRSGDDVQQLARLGEMLSAPGIGERPVVADTVKAAGQNMQQEAAHELIGTKCHRFVARVPLGSITFQRKVTPRSSSARSRRFEIATRWVARQIGQHRRRPGKGAFGIDDPFHFA
jgi:hypothetical protein